MKLCKHHHVMLCDKWPDAVLDALRIPASDSGDYRHVNENECAVCERKEEFYEMDKKIQKEIANG